MFKKTSLLFVVLSLVFIASPIRVEAAPTINSITPNTANNWGTVEITDIAGTGFEEWSEVTLTRAGQTDIEVMAVFESDIKITGKFDATGMEPGVWDVVVTNAGVTATLPGALTINQQPAPTITSNTPDLEDDMGIATIELTGDNFLSGAHVQLIQSGMPSIDAINVVVNSDTLITCKFNLTGVDVGHWDIKVINPDGQTGLSNSIDIAASQASVDCTLIVDNADLYVDALNGDNNTGDGSQNFPWQTITYALNAIANCTASPTGITLHVAAGNYNPTMGETFPLVMLDGVSIVGDDARTTIIDAQNADPSMISFYNVGDGESIEKLTIQGSFLTTEKSAVNSGNGILCEQNSSPAITNCIIKNTRRAGIYSDHSSPTITNSIILGNAERGISLIDSPDVVITNCTVTKNGKNSGGGLYSYTSSAVIKNTILWGNSYQNKVEIETHFSVIDITYSDIQGGYSGEGNVDLDPKLLFPEKGDWNLQANSPCIDAGTDIGPLPGSDIGGTPRPQGAHYDIGAKEHIPCSTPKVYYRDANGDTLGNPDLSIYVCDSDVPAGFVQDNSDVADYLHVGSGYMYSSIQSAIDDAIDGDIVMVHNGTYYENIYFKGKAIIVRSENGAGVTAIDGGGNGSVVTFNMFEKNSSVLDGFSITNGNIIGSGIYGSGGGIRCQPQTSPLIKNCIITGNTASSNGGGIFCESSPTIDNCTISNNSANNGGGIYYGWLSNPTITNCVVSNNSASSKGGGVYGHLRSTTSMSHCLIYGNSASQGGGIFIYYYSFISITNCTISDNSASSSGGGIYAGSKLRVVNSILWGDTANGSPNEIVSGGEDVITYSDIEGGGYPGIGNINADPLFVGNYQLQVTPTVSPCIDAGHPRYLDGDGTRADMGVYGGDAPIIPLNITVALDGSGDFTTIQDAIDNSVTGDTITVLPGTYSENILIQKSISLISSDGPDSTIINGTGSGTIVTFSGIRGEALIQGFTIRDGNADVVAGAILSGGLSAPKIVKCIITNNSAHWGGAMYIGNGFLNYSPTIINSTITGNSTVSGAPIFIIREITPIIINSTIADNAAGGGHGGAIRCITGARVIVINSILWGNVTSGDPLEIKLGSGNNFASAAVYYSNVESGWTGIGNINIDPLFVDPTNGDYHLSEGSPCIDAGTSDTVLYPLLPTDDMDGDLRPQGSTYDMGADEYSVCTDADGDTVCDDVDNCPAVRNPDQNDLDGDESGGDVCDPCPYDNLNNCDINRSTGESVPSTGGTVETPDGFVSINIVDNGALTEEKSISITENGQGSLYQVTTTNGQQATALYGVSLGPESWTFNAEVTLAFKWSDADNNGQVDGTLIQEGLLRITKDGVDLTGLCNLCSSDPNDLAVGNPVCDRAANTFYLMVTSFSDFNLVILDEDGDQIANVVDNCPNIANPDQANNDGDSDGDVCDDDDDNDTILDVNDNCQFTANPDQANNDGDTQGDLCDDDDDNDTILDVNDNCQFTANTDQSDVDGDGVGDVCDPCDDRPASGTVTPSDDTLWPPNHDMHTITVDTTNIETHNPDAQIEITAVEITETSSKEASTAYGENIYDENNFEPDYIITGPLTLDLRSERTGASTGRTYIVTVTVSECGGANTYTTTFTVDVPHDQGQ